MCTPCSCPQPSPAAAAAASGGAADWVIDGGGRVRASDADARGMVSEGAVGEETPLSAALGSAAVVMPLCKHNTKTNSMRVCIRKGIQFISKQALGAPHISIKKNQFKKCMAGFMLWYTSTAKDMEFTPKSSNH